MFIDNYFHHLLILQTRYRIISEREEFPKILHFTKYSKEKKLVVNKNNKNLLITPRYTTMQIILIKSHIE